MIDIRRIRELLKGTPGDDEKCIDEVRDALNSQLTKTCDTLKSRLEEEKARVKEMQLAMDELRDAVSHDIDTVDQRADLLAKRLEEEKARGDELHDEVRNLGEKLRLANLRAARLEGRDVPVPSDLGLSIEPGEWDGFWKIESDEAFESLEEASARLGEIEAAWEAHRRGPSPYQDANDEYAFGPYDEDRSRPPPGVVVVSRRDGPSDQDEWSQWEAERDYRSRELAIAAAWEHHDGIAKRAREQAGKLYQAEIDETRKLLDEARWWACHFRFAYEQLTDTSERMPFDVDVTPDEAATMRASNRYPHESVLSFRQRAEKAERERDEARRLIHELGKDVDRARESAEIVLDRARESAEIVRRLLPDHITHHFHWEPEP